MRRADWLWTIAFALVFAALAWVGVAIMGAVVLGQAIGVLLTLGTKTPAHMLEGGVVVAIIAAIFFAQIALTVMVAGSGGDPRSRRSRRRTALALALAFSVVPYLSLMAAKGVARDRREAAAADVRRQQLAEKAARAAEESAARERERRERELREARDRAREEEDRRRAKAFPLE
jgi:hypothetical protein